MVCVAFGAALRAKADGACETAWCGVLPGACQSIFRAELGGCLRNWVSHETHCRHGFKICLQSSNTTYRVTPTRPQENKDLWAFFLTYLRGTDVDCVQVHWVKGQLNYRNATGVTKIHAWFNHWADLAAKKALQGHLSPLYKAVLQDFQKKMALARDVFSFQAGAALIFANDKDSPQVREPVVIDQVRQIGTLSYLVIVEDLHPVVCHKGFAMSLLNWMREIRWAPFGFADELGPLQDTSWLELFWGCVHDTSVLPAFLHYHDWVWVQDDPSLEFAIPSFVTMFRTWKRTFDGILRSGVSVP